MSILLKFQDTYPPNMRAQITGCSPFHISVQLFVITFPLVSLVFAHFEWLGGGD